MEIRAIQKKAKSQVLNSESDFVCCFCLPRMFEEISLRPWKLTRSLSRFLKLGYLKDSNAAAHSVDTGIS